MAAQFDEVWLYNVLQHTQDPKEVVRRLRIMGKLIRVFEWVDTGTAPGHLHDLHEKDLNKWFGGVGKVEQINDRGCWGKCYYGVFLGNE